MWKKEYDMPRGDIIGKRAENKDFQVPHLFFTPETPHAGNPSLLRSLASKLYETKDTGSSLHSSPATQHTNPS
jgi:hypothetical protein